MTTATPFATRLVRSKKLPQAVHVAAGDGRRTRCGEQIHNQWTRDVTAREDEVCAPCRGLPDYEGGFRLLRDAAQRGSERLDEIRDSRWADSEYAARRTRETLLEALEDVKNAPGPAGGSPPQEYRDEYHTLTSAIAKVVRSVEILKESAPRRGIDSRLSLAASGLATSLRAAERRTYHHHGRT